MSFWHALTSTDRHASHDAPYRTGQHVPLAQSRHAPLTTVATSALESRSDLTSPYSPDAPESATNGFVNGTGLSSPSSPYSPGLRSATQRRASSDTVGHGEIQMQNFAEGLPPPPPVAHSWKRIERWAEDNFTELFDNLCEGCTQNDVNELEHELDMTLPLEVRESLMIHDGQERGGLPTGLIFGMMLLDCEEIVQEWHNWKKVNEEFLTRRPSVPLIPPVKAFSGSGPSSSSAPPTSQSPVNGYRRSSSVGSGNATDILSRQASQPPNAVQRAYAHPSWIPIARDWGGNHLAVDLAPGPMGKWGQIIIFGRDYDTKYVVARSWSSFLASFADDLTCGDVEKGGKVYIHEDDEGRQHLRLKEFRQPEVNPPYLEVLRWRCDQKHGGASGARKVAAAAAVASAGAGGAARRRLGGPNGLRVNSSLSPHSSPYGSPVSASAYDERGRSRDRFQPPHRAGTASPRSMISSPLARVAEEATAPAPVKPGAAVETLEKLVALDTPRPSEEDIGNGTAGPRESVEVAAGGGVGSDKENAKPGALKGKGKSSGVVMASEMKTVEI